ncbi:proline iminopeptidase-family hydrolase [Cesiribacter andamanensis]|uniref:Proline iminopeptidase n=1 Tax=Cesiribacter andamanensis AMV16 TaxID=1279009 RepID=M7N2Z9_9BACT|nr:proline iminopeptidase-family hydrolase [Cesiribacter andamanensis]EMR03058.1 Proline iminopeptidase [Cesiribacter andamanensis AMV16]
MKSATLLTALIALFILACNTSEPLGVAPSNDYLQTPEPGKLQTGGVRMIDIQTPSGTFKVWTKRVGNNPTKKLLLLHGGPGGTHELFECFDSFLPQEGIEYYYYDQLGSYYSDQPQDSSLWQTERFVEEVEQVRQALGLNKDNFYLLGHSWGGILALEYALKYQQHLKGMIISNMMASVPAYNEYAAEVLAPQMDPQVLAELKEMEARQDFDNPRYMELLMPHFYTKHVLRMPVEEWPEPANRMFKHLNPTIYVLMQGYSEFGITGDARLKEWDRTADLPSIQVPTLTIGGAHDTMDPKHMEWMATQVQQGRYLHCPEGSHCAMYDDQQTYFAGLIRFIHEVDRGNFKQ